MSGSADNGGEDGSWGVISGEAGLAHAGTIIHNKSGNFVVTHVCLFVLSDGNTQMRLVRVPYCSELAVILTTDSRPTTLITASELSSQKICLSLRTLPIYGRPVVSALGGALPKLGHLPRFRLHQPHFGLQYTQRVVFPANSLQCRLIGLFWIALSTHEQILLTKTLLWK